METWSNNLWVPVVKIRDFDITGAVFRKAKPDYYDLIPFCSYLENPDKSGKYLITVVTRDGVVSNGNFKRYIDLKGSDIILPNGNKLTL